MSNYFSSDTNIESIEQVYDTRIPEALAKLSSDDLSNNQVMDSNTVRDLTNHLNRLLKQIPEFNPPTFIPKQTYVSGQQEMDNLKTKVSDATTNTPSSPQPLMTSTTNEHHQPKIQGTFMI